MDWPRRGHATTATSASGAITHCWPSPAGTGDVLMARLREGRANTDRGAALVHELMEARDERRLVNLQRHRTT